MIVSPKTLIYDVQFEEMVRELKEECNISEIIALDQSDQESDYEKFFE